MKKKIHFPMKNASFQNYNSQKLFVHQGTLLYAQLIYIYTSSSNSRKILKISHETRP